MGARAGETDRGAGEVRVLMEEEEEKERIMG